MLLHHSGNSSYQVKINFLVVNFFLNYYSAWLWWPLYGPHLESPSLWETLRDILILSHPALSLKHWQLAGLHLDSLSSSTSSTMLSILHRWLTVNIPVFQQIIFSFRLTSSISERSWWWLWLDTRSIWPRLTLKVLTMNRIFSENKKSYLDLTVASKGGAWLNACSE